MKKSMLILLIAGMVFLLPGTALGLYTPGVSDRHGVVTVRNIEALGWMAGGEFGLTEDLAIIADFGENDYNRAGLKFQLNPDLSLLGGVTDSKLFIGVNFGGELTETISGIVEIDVYSLNDRLAFDYELGIKLDLTRHLDLRGGLLGTVTESETTNYYQLGMGYKF